MVRLKIVYGLFGIKSIEFDGEVKHFNKVIKMIEDKEELRKELEKIYTENQNGTFNNY